MSKEMKNKKAAGPNGITNEAFRYISLPYIILIIKFIIDYLLNTGKILRELNTGCIKPLIKDFKKSKKDLNNLRPIMLSDALTNFIEKVLLKMIERTLTLSKYQYGFRSNSSCLHALFVAKETILHYI